MPSRGASPTPPVSPDLPCLRLDRANRYHLLALDPPAFTRNGEVNRPTTLGAPTHMPINETTVEATYERLREKLHGVVPDFELKLKAELVLEINKLKAERGAIILGHNYMEPALFHSVPDITGDSLELCRRAAATDRDPIVFCGVVFMAETAKILNPDRTVLIPSEKAGCSLAASITGEDVRKLKAKYPGVPVVTYINTYADVKAETDIVCTSGNAAAVIESLESETVIFLPDEYLARNVAEETGRHIIFPVKAPSIGIAVPGPTPGDTQLDVDLIGWHGRCARGGW